MKKRYKLGIWLGIAIVFLGGVGVDEVSAYRMEKMDKPPERRNFDVGPTSFGIELSPGESAKRTIQVTDWIKEYREDEFQVEIEDFVGSSNLDETIALQGSESGRFGAKEWVKPEISDFKLNFGDRIFLDIEIKVPESADAGDHYAAVLVSNIPKKSDEEGSVDSKKSNVLIKSRVGVLLFVRVKGPVNEEGQLVSFEKDKKWYEKSPVKLQTIFENKGTVRLQPHGKIEIRNMLGKVSDSIDIEPYNVLRESSRKMSYQWDGSGFLIGRYVAKIKIDRGYGDLADEKEVSFWIIPWKIILVIILVLILVRKIFKYLGKKVDFQVKLKKKK